MNVIMREVFIMPCRCRGVAIFIQPAKCVAIFIQPASLSCDHCGLMQAARRKRMGLICTGVGVIYVIIVSVV